MKATCVDILKDTELKTVDEVANCMGQRDVWQAMSTEDVNCSWRPDRIELVGHQNRTILEMDNDGL